jgi:hypothetical protein
MSIFPGYDERYSFSKVIISRVQNTYEIVKLKNRKRE